MFKGGVYFNITFLKGTDNNFGNSYVTLKKTVA